MDNKPIIKIVYDDKDKNQKDVERMMNSVYASYGAKDQFDDKIKFIPTPYDTFANGSLYYDRSLPLDYKVDKIIVIATSMISLYGLYIDYTITRDCTPFEKEQDEGTEIVIAADKNIYSNQLLDEEFNSWLSSSNVILL